MDIYQKKAINDMRFWQNKMQKPPSISSKATKGLQIRINRMIPEKMHQLITKAVKGMTRTVLFGAEITSSTNGSKLNFQETEFEVINKINFYRSSAATEGAITGFGGFVSGLIDFPLWMSLKIKMLFEIANLYGYNTNDFKERIFILYIFEITFSSQENRNILIDKISNWNLEEEQISDNIDDFDWRNFQIEYRDHLDMAKLMQLIPGLGAIVGAYINHKYTKKLGQFAMNAYRMRKLIDINKIAIT